MIAALRQFNTRDAPPNTRIAYASSETEVLGLVVSRAVHMPLADYLATRIWQKLGAESDAAWAIDPTGQEVAYCCFIATLRDWARLGLMLANDGAWNGQQIVPRQWLLDATAVPRDGYLRNTIAQPGATAIRSGYCRESGECSFSWVLVDRISSSTPSRS